MQHGLVDNIFDLEVILENYYSSAESNRSARPKFETNLAKFEKFENQVAESKINGPKLAIQAKHLQADAQPLIFDPRSISLTNPEENSASLLLLFWIVIIILAVFYFKNKDKSKKYQKLSQNSEI